MSPQKQKKQQELRESYIITLKDQREILIFGLVALFGVILLNIYYNNNDKQEWDPDQYSDGLDQRKYRENAKEGIKSLWWELQHFGPVYLIQNNKTFGIFLFIAFMFVVYGLYFKELMHIRKIQQKKRFSHQQNSQQQQKQSPIDKNLREESKGGIHVQQISVEEFEQQKRQYTQEKVKQLQRSYEYRAMKRQKSDKKENWNWQTYEKKHGASESEESSSSSQYERSSVSNFSEEPAPPREKPYHLRSSTRKKKRVRFFE